MIKTCLICRESQIRFHICSKCSQQNCIKCYKKYKKSRKEIDGIVYCMFCNTVEENEEIEQHEKAFIFFVIAFYLLLAVFVILYFQCNL